MCGMNELELFFTKHDESINSCLLALKSILIAQDPEISCELKYGMPFFCYRKKMFCYLWMDKKLHMPYLGFVEGNKIHHENLIQGNRARMKVMIIDPNKDIPIKTIQIIVKKALFLYKSGIVKIKNKPKS